MASWVKGTEIPGLFTAHPSASAVKPASAVKAAAPSNNDATVTEAPSGHASQKKSAQKPKSDVPAAPLLAVVQWLGTNLLGTIVLGAVGMTFLLLGGCGAVSAWRNSTPTEISVAELEKSDEAPSGYLLKITDGYLFWPEMVRVTRKSDGETLQYYVPVVSKAVVDEWLPKFKEKNTKAKYSYAKARVVVKIRPETIEEIAPKIANKDKKIKVYFKEYETTGMVGSFVGLPDIIGEQLTSNAEKHDAARMVLIHDGARPWGVTFPMCVMLFGALFLIPLGIILVRDYMPKKGAAKPKAAPAQSKPTPAPAETATPAAAAQSVPAPASQPASQAVQATAPPTQGGYYFSRAGKKYGPYTVDKLKEFAKTRQLVPTDQIWLPSDKKWVAGSSVPGIFS